MQIEAGEYIRTDDGIIAKIKEKAIYILEVETNTGEIRYYNTEKISKHSKNIIDLIEVGDFVNGYKVSKKQSTLLITHVEGIDKSGYIVPISQFGEDIKAVLTHEQYNKDCFKLEEE